MPPDHEFRAVAEQIFAFHRRGQYAQALAAVNAATRRFPERAETTTYWSACLQARLGQNERAVQTLKAGRARGLWWPPEMLRWDEDFAQIREWADFAAIMTACEDHLRAAQADARMHLRVERPAQHDLHAPLVIALSWRGRPIDDFDPWWLPVVRQGAILALVRSSQPLGMRSFGWDDPVRSRQDVAEAFRILRRTEMFDAAKVIVAGASQGAALAIHLALREEIIPVRGVIAVVPALGDFAGYSSALATAAQHDLRIYLVTGEQDEGRTSVEALCSQFGEAGVPYQIHIAPGVGHDFPLNFEELLPSALSFILRN